MAKGPDSNDGPKLIPPSVLLKRAPCAKNSGLVPGTTPAKRVKGTEGSVTIVKDASAVPCGVSTKTGGENVIPWSVLTNRPWSRVATYRRVGLVFASTAIALTLA